jgi:D-sedoheptulose 7-phosphate isomerase
MDHTSFFLDAHEKDSCLQDSFAKKNEKDIISRQISDSIKVKELFFAEKYINKIDEIAKTIVTAYKNGNKVILCGNGGSASDAQHIEGELVGRFKMERRALAAIAITANSATATAISNDYGYDDIFRRQVEAHGVAGDVLIGFSTSGNSANILAAVEQAGKTGIITIGFLGKSGGRLKEMVDIPFIVPSEDTPRIQECHILIGHIVCGLVEKGLFED